LFFELGHFTVILCLNLWLPAVAEVFVLSCCCCCLCVSAQDDKGKSKCFGFINYVDADAAARAVDSLTGKELSGKSLYAGRAQKKAEREAMLRSQFEEKRAERVQKYQGMNLYVKNLHDDITDDILREEFTPFGSITSAKVGCLGRNIASWVGCKVAICPGHCSGSSRFSSDQ
jgi:hypothetical protein